MQTRQIAAYKPEELSDKVKTLKEDLNSHTQINIEKYATNYLASMLVNVSFGDPYLSGPFKTINFWNGKKYTVVIPSFEKVFSDANSKERDQMFNSLAILVNEIDYAFESENLNFSNHKLSQYNSSQEFESDFAKSVGGLVRHFISLEEKYKDVPVENPLTYGFGIPLWSESRMSVLQRAINDKCKSSKSNSNFRNYFFKE